MPSGHSEHFLKSPDLVAPHTRALFPLTRWSLVRRASGGDDALGEWLGLYWYPLYAWARRRDTSPEDAADAVQSFLGKLCERSLLAQVDATRGKLRSWLLTSFSNFLATEHTKALHSKRGGDVAHVPIDWPGVETAYLADAGDHASPERVYARTWAITLLDQALDLLARHYESTGRTALFEALLPALESPLEETTYAEVATRLGMSGAALRQGAVRLRERYRRALLEVAATRLAAC